MTRRSLTTFLAGGCLAGVMAGGFAASAQAQPTADAVALTLNNPAAPMVDTPTRVPVFFPPTPPVLGAAAPNPSFLDLRWRAPTELATWIGEPFYAPLGSLYAERLLTAKLAARLDAFLAQRRALEAELTARLAVVASLSPAERERELAALRIAQAPALAAWEAVGEELRHDCAEASGDWSSLRQFLPADPEPAGGGRQRDARRTALLSVAYFQDGLSPAQRDLLHEMAARLEASSYSPERALVMAKDRRGVFFLPAISTITVPLEPGASLAAKLAAFEELKEALKRELEGSLEAGERALWRSRYWRKLAETQAGRFAELERRAEELRHDFERAATPFRPAFLPGMPAEFAGRFHRYRQEFDRTRLDFARALDGRLGELLAYKPGSGAVAYRVGSFAYAGAPLGTAGPTVFLHTLQFLPLPAATETERKILAQLKPTVDAQRQKLETEARVLDEERKALEEAYAKIAGLGGKIPPDQALALMLGIAAQNDEWERFATYRQAVLLPGLSPTQRRLLFGVAQRQLTRPLPGGELQIRR